MSAGRILLRLSSGAAVLGVVLLAINLYGLVTRDVHPRARAYRATEVDRSFRTPQQAFAELDELESGKQRLSFDDQMKNITHIFASAIVHYWPELEFDGGQDADLLVSFAENYPTFISDRIRILRERYVENVQSPRVHYYEYYEYKPSVRRGVGLCSQAAKAVADYLRTRQGLRAGLLFLDGHVVAYAQRPADGGMVILDADYDVYLPFGLEYAETHQAVVRQHYEDAGISGETSSIIAAYYADTNNRVGEPVRLYNDRIQETEKRRNHKVGCSHRVADSCVDPVRGSHAAPKSCGDNG